MKKGAGLNSRAFSIYRMEKYFLDGKLFFGLKMHKFDSIFFDFRASVDVSQLKGGVSHGKN